MATVVLSTVGATLGGAVGGPIGVAVGRALGAAVGAVVDQQIFGGGRDEHYDGPRLESLGVTSSSEGAAINRVYGRARLGGEVIWATHLEEVITSDTQSQGGKGGQGSATTTTNYTYYANFAVGLCEGSVAYINRIWADGKEVDLSNIEYRFYAGTETQNPDTLIESVEGVGAAPAYRGLCYVVFERLALAKFGNRIPQLTFEIIRPSSGPTLENAIRGVNLIPGSTEFGYDTDAA